MSVATSAGVYTTDELARDHLGLLLLLLLPPPLLRMPPLLPDAEYEGYEYDGGEYEP